MSVATWTPAYVGIGSNLEEPRQQIARGLAALAALPDTRLLASSRVYISSPLGPQDQPAFVNAVAGLLTQLDAHALLSNLKRLERELGRQEPVVRWGPRVIDFDLLVFGGQQIDTEQLKVPHQGLGVRNFAIYPLHDIAPSLHVPGLGSVAHIKAKVERGDLSELA